MYFARFAETRDKDLAWKLVCHNIGLVISIAKTFQGRGLEFDDLVSEGLRGALRAVELFDLGRGVKFSTYATCSIRRKIIRAIDEYGQTIRVPHVTQTERKGFIGAAEAASQEHGVTIGLDGVLLASDAPPKTKRRLRGAAFARISSLDHVVSAGEGGVPFRVKDTVADPGCSPLSCTGASEDLAVFRRILSHFLGVIDILPIEQRDKEIFRLYELQPRDEHKEHTLDSLGAQFGGISRERVRQIVKEVWGLIARVSRISSSEIYQGVSDWVDRLTAKTGNHLLVPVPIPPMKFSDEQKSMILQLLGQTTP